MAETELKILLKLSTNKLIKSINILKASLNKIVPYDDKRDYTYDELEPYDALCDRFIRTVEVAIKYFRTLQIYNEAEKAETYRDLLNYAEKHLLILSAETWFEMREIRNRIAHDYLPEKVKAMYADIIGPFAIEIEFLEKALNTKSSKNSLKY